MARAPDQRIEQAKAMYLQGKKLVDIAEELGLPEGTVRSWKNRYKWGSNSNATLQKRKRNVAKEKAIASDVEQVIENPDLTDKQRLFCLHYVRCFNATKAYQKAYGCSYEVAMVEGNNTLRKPKIKKEVQRLKQNRLNREMLDEHDIFQKYLDIAFADITDYVTFGTREVQYIDKAGDERTVQVPFVDLKDSSGVDGTLVSEVKQGKEGASIKLADRMRALDWLASHIGMATEEQKARLEQIRAQTARISLEPMGEEEDGVEIINDTQKEAGTDIGDHHPEVPQGIQQQDI